MDNDSSRLLRLHAREVLDSRGNPTIEVEAHCQGGAAGRAIVPSGKSTGTHEAMEFRDGDKNRYEGKGVLKAIGHVNQILAPNLRGMDVVERERIDRRLIELDGTPHKSRLGANALLGASLACAHASASVQRLPLWRTLAPDMKPSLPRPMVNMISGGLHAGGNLDVQDFLFVPLSASAFSRQLQQAVAVYRALGRRLHKAGHEAFLVGDEGGFGPKLRDCEEALQSLVDAFNDTGMTPGRDAGIALDIASSHFYRDGLYHMRTARGLQKLTSREMIERLEQWVDRFPIMSIEDGLAEDDWDGWHALTKALGDKVQLIGDDLFVTNSARLKRGLDEGIANAVLVKMNQIGTLTETLEVVAQARAAGYRTVISARSGETEDSTMADLAVASGAGQIKIGSVARSERLAKYNQLLRIEEAFLGERGVTKFSGGGA